METASIGYHKDGGFVILATINNNDGNIGDSSFDELVKELHENITKRVCNPNIQLEIIERQDTPDCVDLGNTPRGIAHPRNQAILNEASATSDAEFKNFHRLLCTQFGYTHDEKDWKRDQASLIEWIRKLVDSSGPFVIYSPSESAFWNECSGWGAHENATRYTLEETCIVLMPASVGHDARWKIINTKSESAVTMVPADIEAVTAEHDAQSKSDAAVGQGRQQSTLKNYVVLYRVDSIMSDHDAPFSFQCYADDSEHAKEQCLDAYPDCDVVWVWQESAGVGMKPALDEYWASKQVSDDEVICPHCGEKSHIGGLIGPLANQCPKCGKQCDGQKPNPITSFNLVVPTIDEMNQYDAVELHPVESTIDKDGQVICLLIEDEQIGSNPLAAYSWSVYLHLKEGGTDVAGDFPTKELADAFAAFADLALVHAAQVAKT